MIAFIITIGDELLIGQTVDTNSAWMGAELSRSGFDVARITSVHDLRDDITEALNSAIGKADVVLITGGLGPTSDDITKNTLCEYFGTRLISDPGVLSMIEDLIGRRGFSMNDNNQRQAEVPESCRVLTNATGTAPGMWFEKDGTIFISMPGVPHEMKYIMSTHVIPELNKRFRSQVIIHKNIMTYGTFEARLAEILIPFEAQLPSQIRLAYLPSAGVIKLRLTAKGNDRNELEALLEEQVRLLYSTIPRYIYGEDEDPLELTIGKLLRNKNMTLSTAESCTGGDLAHRITSIAGSSDYYLGSVVSYSNSAKINLLGVDPALIEEFGAVSEQVVRAMAEGARKIFGSDYSIATSGIAGPGGGSDAKPVGTVWIAISSPEGTSAVLQNFGKERQTNIMRFSNAALDMLRRQIISL